MKKYEKIFIQIAKWCELPLAILFLEWVFHLSTFKAVSGPFVLFSILFSLALGALLELLLSLVPPQRPYFIVKLCVLILLPIPMLVSYFVYCKFNIFYDLNTVFGGAGGAVGGFGSDIVQLIFCANGIFHILLFYLPVILYAVFHKKLKIGMYLSKKWERLTAGLTSGVLYIAAILLICLVPQFQAVAKTQYNYSDAMQNFGFYVGTLLDATGSGSGTSFTIESTESVDWTTQVVEVESTEGEETTEEEPKVYGYNVTDIDFAALAESTSDDDLAALDEYVASLTPTRQNEYTGMFAGKNLIFITAEAFSAEVIDEERTPTLYRMATKGINFTDYYQPACAGTTGGEYNNIFGLLPSEGGMSMKDAADNYNYMTMGYLLNEQGYWGKAYHDNDYTFYSRDITHNALGYSEGFMGMGNGMEEYVQSYWPESDLEMIEGTVQEYIDQDHFNVYYMTVSGHSNYEDGANYQAGKHQDAVADLPYSAPVKNYLAANVELDEAMEYLINALEEAGIADDTVIVLSADHFPYGLDEDGDSSMPYLQELYGTTIDNDFVRDHNRLIIWSGCLEDEDPIIVDSPTFSLDILPTLCNLFGLEYDSRLLVGRDVFSDAEPLVFNDSYEWKTDLGTYVDGTFTPVSDDVVIPDGYVSEMKTIVANKISYCDGVLNYDYYRHVFGQ